MGFLSGAATFERYWISNDSTPDLGPEHLKVLDKFKIGAVESSAIEQANVGFLAGSHLLDTKFELEKNVILDAMHFGIRIDSDQIPAAVRNAWLQMELLPLTINNPSGKPTKAQRTEAKEAVEARCAEEAASGKFRRMQQVPVLWDAHGEVMYLGGTSANVNEACVELLERAFDIQLDRITSGKLATAYATDTEQLEAMFELTPADFLLAESGASITWWNGMSDNHDYLGNEFLLWLWWQFERKSDTIELSDESRVSGMFARTLMLDCPLGESGKETISAISPVALPEAALAIRSGKLPRKAGLTLVRNNEQYDLTLRAETFAVGGAKITQLGDAEIRETADRIASVREMSDTIDLLFEVYCERRLGKQWKSELKKMQNWLQSETSVVVRKAAA